MLHRDPSMAHYFSEVIEAYSPLVMQDVKVNMRTVIPWIHWVVFGGCCKRMALGAAVIGRR